MMVAALAMSLFQAVQLETESATPLLIRRLIQTGVNPLQSINAATLRIQIVLTLIGILKFIAAMIAFA